MIRQRKRQFTQQQLGELSLPIVSRMKALLRGSRTIVAYYSLDDEVNTHSMIDDLVADGKTVYLPKVVSDTEMVLCCYTGRESLSPGAYGIMEPVGPVVSADATFDVVLVPGMAFDDNGHRLGRGKGYYDRFLRTLSEPRPLLVGVCFDFQKIGLVPTETCDVSVDIVV